ncbi:putative mitochondrial protein, partial [Mucuna pruriens]
MVGIGEIDHMTGCSKMFSSYDPCSSNKKDALRTLEWKEAIFEEMKALEKMIKKGDYGYILDLLNETRTSSCRPIDTPIDPNKKLCDEKEDWADLVTDRTSALGYCTYVRGNLVTWRSKKQNVVTRRSAKSKYRAMDNRQIANIFTKGFHKPSFEILEIS